MLKNSSPPIRFGINKTFISHLFRHLFATDNFCCHNTVKFLNFRTPEKFAVIYLKLKKKAQTLEYFVKKNANGIANSEDPDQTAPLGAV